MEKRLCAECEGNGKVLAMCSDCNGTGYAIASPAPEPAPQTFEEWWDEARRLFFPDIADGVELTRIKNGALAGWNAAKASSPAAKKEHEPLEWGTNCPQAPDRGPHECAGNDATCVHSGKQGHVCLRCGCYCLCQWCNEGNLRIRSSVSERLVHTDTPVGRVACIDQPSSPAVAGERDATGGTMSYGLVICSHCKHEVHQSGNRNLANGWQHCDGSIICESGLAVYPKSKDEIVGSYCGIDDCEPHIKDARGK